MDREMNIQLNYDTLLQVFKYLDVPDLLRAGSVCTLWRDASNDPTLWRTVTVKNTRVNSFEKLAYTLQKNRTVNLDLREILVPKGRRSLWSPLPSPEVHSLRKIELCRCPANVVQQIATSNPMLEVIRATSIYCGSISLNPFFNLVNLNDLRLNATASLMLNSDLSALSQLKQLKHLSLTSIPNLVKLNVDVIANLSELTSLELGECTDFPDTFATGVLCNLKKLERLRLEKGQGACNTFWILDAVKDMPKLEELELVNFNIEDGFNDYLSYCSNIKRLLIIPTYCPKVHVTRTCVANEMILDGVLYLANTLTHFVLGITLEQLRQTERYLNAHRDNEHNGQMIIVEAIAMGDLVDIRILPLPALHTFLRQQLPNTRVEILQIPFESTWKQTIADTFQ